MIVACVPCIDIASYLMAMSNGSNKQTEELATAYKFYRVCILDIRNVKVCTDLCFMSSVLSRRMMQQLPLYSSVTAGECPQIGYQLRHWASSKFIL